MKDRCFCNERSLSFTTLHLIRGELNESSSKHLRACFCLADGMVIFGKYFARLTEKFKA